MSTSALQRLTKFDPAEHPGDLYDSFCDFIDSFAYEYEALSRGPPAGHANPAEWSEQDKRKQLLGRCASRNLQRDFEDEVVANERTTISFTDTVQKLKA